MKHSKIEWTDATWNPVRGCSIVSAGCQNCYAMKMAYRFSGPGLPYEGLTRMTGHGPVWTGNIKLVEEALEVPLRTRKPTKFFVNSMSDLFHEGVPDQFIIDVFHVMRKCPQHTFQILTKRADRMLEFITNCAINPYGSPYEPLPNVWLGVSVENQKTADERIPILLSVPAAVRFLSMEPLLGPVELWHFDDFDRRLKGVGIIEKSGVSTGTADFPAEGYEASYPGIDWVIVGGESGTGARPMHPDWVRSIRDQCQAASVPFFFKQWGSWLPWEPDAQPPFWNSQAGHFVDGHGLHILDPETNDTSKGWDDGMWGIDEGLSDCSFQNVGKHAAGRSLDGKTYDEFPAITLTPV